MQPTKSDGKLDIVEKPLSESDSAPIDNSPQTTPSGKRDKRAALAGVLTAAALTVLMSILSIMAFHSSTVKPPAPIKNIKVAMTPQPAPEGAAVKSGGPAMPGKGDIYKRLMVHDGKRTAYLTFDDGPSPNVTPKVLDILKEEGIKATFFLVGSNVDKYPSIARREAQEGHSVGNHSYSHAYSQVYKSVDDFVFEIDKTQQALQNAIGKGYTSKLLRFPGGSFGDKMLPYREKISELGFEYVDWNCLAVSASYNGTPQHVDEALRRTASNYEDLIILMHDAPAKTETYTVLPYVIKTLRDLGFSFDEIRP